MLFAIRDDDTSYFTKPEELESAYDFVQHGCISLSVVPFTVPVHKDCVFPYGGDIPYREYALTENPSLVSYLKDSYAQGRYDILLHGYSHEYQNRNNQWEAELIWKDAKRIETELAHGKQLLERALNCSIRILVAPNNQINQNGIAAVEKLGLNYSGILLRRDRMVDTCYIRNYLIRWGYRALYGIPYGGVLSFRYHKELVAYTLDSFERLKRAYHRCKKEHHPFVLYTHYWSLTQGSPSKLLLQEIYDYMMADGAQLVPLSECFDR